MPFLFSTLCGESSEQWLAATRATAFSATCFGSMGDTRYIYRDPRGECSEFWLAAMRATAFGAAFCFQLLAEGTESNRNLLLQGLFQDLNFCSCLCGRRSGRLIFPSVFVEDAQEDTLLHVFLWKTLKLIKTYILCYIFSSLVRLPQKHNSFSVFFSVFHKNTGISASPSTSSTKSHGGRFLLCVPNWGNYQFQPGTWQSVVPLALSNNKTLKISSRVCLKCMSGPS